MIAPTYQPRPTKDGNYWMKWWRKYCRTWRYDMVWYWASSPSEVRLMGCQPIETYPNATFYGPLVPPEEKP